MIAYNKMVSGTVKEAYHKVVGPDQPGDIPWVPLLAASSIAAAEVDKVAQSVYKLGESRIRPGRPLGVRSRRPVALGSALRRMAKADGELDVAPSLMTLANEAKEACLVKLGRPLPIEDCPRPNQNSPFLG